MTLTFATKRRSVTSSHPLVMLALATLGFGLNFWAWALLSPLGTRFKDDLALSSFQTALLVAIPVIVGALGRIPVGALTDRYGGRVMFPTVSLATVAPVLYVGLVGHASYAGLLVGGFFLGVAGTAFAVGVPFVNAWFPPEQRGTAIGVFGIGMGGGREAGGTQMQAIRANRLLPSRKAGSGHQRRPGRCSWSRLGVACAGTVGIPVVVSLARRRDAPWAAATCSSDDYRLVVRGDVAPVVTSPWPAHGLGFKGLLSVVAHSLTA